MYLISEECGNKSYEFRFISDTCHSKQILISFRNTKFTTSVDYLKGKNVINTRRDLRFVQIS